MAGVANDHFAWRLQGFYSQPWLTWKGDKNNYKALKTVSAGRTCLFECCAHATVQFRNANCTQQPPVRSIMVELLQLCSGTGVLGGP